MPDDVRSLDGTAPVDVVRVGPGARHPGRDVAAAEEPLEIRIGDATFVVVMRTPGADEALAAGFLVAERIVEQPDEVGSIRPCATTTPEDEGNVVSAWLTGAAAGRAAERLAGRRHVVAGSACGVCGRRSIDDLLCDLPAVNAAWAIAPAVVRTLPDTLRAAQAAFDRSGGMHAAGLFDPEGHLMAMAEDVGRHNAVDKVVGGQLLAGRWPLDARLLFVSGRTSFEIVQKAVTARIPVVAAVSAPSTLAIDLARRAGVTLLGFVRGATFNIYTAPSRILDET